MAIRDMRALLRHELGDLLYAEKQILKALPKMTKEVHAPELTARLRQHERETKDHVRNLELAFEAIGEKARGQKCDGILGILGEHDAFKSDEGPSPSMLEAFDLGAGLRVEHYEIAAYENAIALAKAEGLTEVAKLLLANLRQEQAMAKFLTSTTPRTLRSLGEQAPTDGDGPARRRSRRKAVR